MTRRRLTMFADYGGAFPLWKARGGFMVGREELPLPDGLIAELTEWGKEYDDTLSSNEYQWPNKDLMRAWNDRGRELAGLVALELQVDYEIEYLDAVTGERSIVRPARR